MDDAQIAIVAGATVAAGWLIARWNAAQDAQPADAGSDAGMADQGPGLIEGAMQNLSNTIVGTLGLWRPPPQYAAQIAAAEDRYGIPRDLLARLLYQESRYRSDIISGATASPAGALGIAQFMPGTAADLGINPLDAAQAIDAAGSYLARLYRATGTWTQALAAYNWGIGNVQRQGLAAAPRETKNYFTQILADVNAANGTSLA